MKGRGSLAVPADVARLLDPTEQADAIKAFRENNGQPELALTIQREVISPLENWVSKEYEKWGQHTAIEQAQDLIRTAEDLQEKWSRKNTAVPELIEALDEKWQELIKSMAYAAVELWSRHEDQRSAARVTGGRNRAGKKEPLADAIIAAFRLMGCANVSNEYLLQQIRDDIDGKAGSLFSILRENKQTAIKFTKITGQDIFYMTDDGRPRVIQISSLRPKISGLRRSIQ